MNCAVWPFSVVVGMADPLELRLVLKEFRSQGIRCVSAEVGVAGGAHAVEGHMQHKVGEQRILLRLFLPGQQGINVTAHHADRVQRVGVGIRTVVGGVEALAEAWA